MENITLIISVKTGTTNEIINDLSTRWGYNVSSGLTKAQFIRQKIAQHIKAELLAHRSGEASAVTNSQMITDVDALNIS